MVRREAHHFEGNLKGAQLEGGVYWGRRLLLVGLLRAAAMPTTAVAAIDCPVARAIAALAAEALAERLHKADGILFLCVRTTAHWECRHAVHSRRRER